MVLTDHHKKEETIVVWYPAKIRQMRDDYLANRIKKVKHTKGCHHIINSQVLTAPCDSNITSPISGKDVPANITPLFKKGTTDRCKSLVVNRGSFTSGYAPSLKKTMVSEANVHVSTIISKT